MKAKIVRQIAAIGIAGLITSSAMLAAVPASDELARAHWRESIVKIETPFKGCFQTTYPSFVWQPTACGEGGPRRNHTRPRIAHPGQPQTTGDGTDYALVAGALISKTVGSFPAVSGLTSESNVAVPAGSGGSPVPNMYSLQINTNDNLGTAACSGCASKGADYQWGKDPLE